jgi:hypothetical protein
MLPPIGRVRCHFDKAAKAATFDPESQETITSCLNPDDPKSSLMVKGSRLTI